MYLSNPKNSDFGDLPFYGDQRLITGWLIYCSIDDIIEGFKMVWFLMYILIECKKNKM